MKVIERKYNETSCMTLTGPLQEKADEVAGILKTKKMNNEDRHHPTHQYNQSCSLRLKIVFRKIAEALVVEISSSTYW